MKQHFFIAVLCLLAATALAQNPETEAKRLKGNVSCVQVFTQEWSTRFGEKELGEKKGGPVFCYDEQHRLLSKHTNYETPFWTANVCIDYHLDEENNIRSIDVYTTRNAKSPELMTKFRFETKDGVRIAHIYGTSGAETAVFSPWNSWVESWYYDTYTDEVELYHKIIAFDLQSVEPKNRGKIKVEKNKKGQIVRRYEYSINRSTNAIEKNGEEYEYKYNDAGQLIESKVTVHDATYNSHIKTFEYDEQGNLTAINYHRRNLQAQDTHTYGDSGTRTIFVYTYGEFNTPYHRTFSEMKAAE